jgi:predicted GH43/DUF377 family glycosyl hydrolase
MITNAERTPVELFTRFDANPILQGSDWPYPINTVFNPAATLVDGETVVLARCEDRRGVSHLALARSEDGLTNWKIAPEPFLVADESNELEVWGFEDPRVTRIDELNRWVIACTTYGPAGPGVFLATTKDWVQVEKYGLVMPPDDKNAAPLPRRINGEWVLFHRPIGARTGGRNGDIWLSRSADLESWKAPERVLGHREGPWWDAVRVGIGPGPIETEMGWLLIYHGVKDTPAGCIYRVGLAMLDIDNPAVVTHRSPTWVMTPSASYEIVGDVPNVIFPCGATVHDDGTLYLYYGAADTSIGVATAKVSELLDYLRQHPV